jgi:hypothetical protein
MSILSNIYEHFARESYQKNMIALIHVQLPFNHTKQRHWYYMLLFCLELYWNIVCNIIKYLFDPLFFFPWITPVYIDILYIARHLCPGVWGEYLCCKCVWINEDYSIFFGRNLLLSIHYCQIFLCRFLCPIISEWPNMRHWILLPQFFLCIYLMSIFVAAICCRDQYIAICW